MHPLPPPPLPLPPPQVDKLLDQQQLLLGMISSGATLGPPATGAQPGGRGQRQQTKAIAVASPSAEEGHRGDCLRHGLGEGGRDWGKGARGVRKYFSCAEYHMIRVGNGCRQSIQMERRGEVGAGLRNPPSSSPNPDLRLCTLK